VVHQAKADYLRGKPWGAVVFNLPRM
jgi:hypothetical protein